MNVLKTNRNEDLLGRFSSLPTSLIPIQTVQIDVLECLIDYDGGARDPP